MVVVVVVVVRVREWTTKGGGGRAAVFINTGRCPGRGEAGGVTVGEAGETAARDSHHCWRQRVVTVGAGAAIDRHKPRNNTCNVIEWFPSDKSETRAGKSREVAAVLSP